MRTGIRYHEVHEYRLLHKWGFSPKVPREREKYISKKAKEIISKIPKGFTVAVEDESIFVASKVESFVNLQSFKSAITGKSGSNTEMINGTKMFVAYSPVKLYSTTWAVFPIIILSCYTNYM